jgi:hypothetical protein
MVQTWILREDIAPWQAIRTGDDSSICGDCPLRGIVVDGHNRRRSCYVSVFAAPTQVYNSYRAGKYDLYRERTHAPLFADRHLRLGSYGDPAALPFHKIKRFVRHFAGHTGYCHQWRKLEYQDWRALLMASVQTLGEAHEAHALGWRTFRIIAPDETPNRTLREAWCPASAERGHRLTCEQCGLCKGAPAPRNVAIVGHGSPSQRPALLKILQPA